MRNKFMTGRTPFDSAYLWLVEPETGYLKSPYQIHPELELIKPAQACTVSVKSCVVFEDLDRDFRKENDLLILTHHSLGSQQSIRQVHFWEQEVPQATPIHNLLSNTAFATKDFVEESLWLQFEITEVDTDHRELDGIVSTFKTLVDVLGGAFPLVATYANYAKIAIDVVDKLIGQLERDERVLKYPVRFYRTEPGGRIHPQEPPLQTGDYVIFTKSTRGLAYYMTPDGFVKPRSDIPSGSQLKNVSYISFSIYPKMIAAPEFIVGQQLETLLSQLRYGNQTPDTTLNYLISTMTAYNNVKQLKRYSELCNKKRRGRELTSEEQSLMIEIEKNDSIIEYLPKCD
jgi:hypothetical protein